MYKFHVTNEKTGSKKLLLIGEKSDLKAEIQRRFNVQDFVMQYELIDPDLGTDWLDVETDDDIPESGKLRIIPELSDFARSTLDQPMENPPQSMEALCVPDQPLAIAPLRRCSVGAYRLPKFPLDIEQALIRKDPDLMNDRLQRMKMIKVLAQDLQEIVGMYPSSEDYTAVCSSLVNAHPCLEDKFKAGRQNGSRFATWKNAITQRFKEIRRPLCSNAEIKLRKEKFGSPGMRRQDESQEGEETSLARKRSKVAAESVYSAGEDEDTVKEHLLCLQKEWRKKAPDMSAIDDRMLRTLHSRREIIEKGLEKISVVLDLYPPFGSALQLLKEVQRIRQVDILEKISNYMTEERVGKILMNVQKDKLALAFVDEAKNTNISSLRKGCALAVLPALFGESLSKWIVCTHNALELSAPATDVVLQKRNSWVQLAGHPGNFAPAGPKSIWKRQPKGDLNEAKCLRELMRESLREVVPKFYREVEYNDAVYIEMEDLLKRFKDPSVMDIKIGTRTFQEREVKNPELRHDLYDKMVGIDPGEPTDEEHEQKAVTKLRYMQFRERGSSSESLGFRIEAVRRSGETSNTDFKRVRTKEDVTRAMAHFVGSQSSVCRQFLRRLKDIKKRFEASSYFRHHEVIGSSLLFVYDCDKRANIWMIDFAKTTHVPDLKLTHHAAWKPGNHEDGYLTGIESLIQILKELSSSRDLAAVSKSSDRQ